MSSNCSLEQLIDQWHVAVRLDQHQKIVELDLKIAVGLVSLFDEQLMRQDEDYDNDGNNHNDDGEEDNNDEQSECRKVNELVRGDEWQLVENITRWLRKQSILVQMYCEVLEFVRQFDRECLELASDNDNIQASAGRDDKTFRRALRQCIVLLREININSTAAAGGGGCEGEFNWLPSSRINRLNDISFSRLVVDLSKCDDDDIRTRIYRPNELLEKIQNTKSAPAKQLISQLHSQWFCSFLEASINYRPYLLDKFTLLIALWIIASDCKHAQLGQLASEMIEQIFHQEVNCCQLEELQQLTQVGAIWLSYKKRFMATIGRPQMFGLEVNANDDDDDDDEDDELDESQELAEDSSSLDARPEDPRALIRQLIDYELLVARPCYLCGRTSSQNGSGDHHELMAPIQALRCSWCSLDWWRACDHYYATYCNSSLEPLNWLVPLEDILRSVNRTANCQVLAVSPTEWVQLALDNCATNLRVGLYGPPEAVGGPIDSPLENGEQVDISDKFERLIVVRRTTSDELKSDDDDEFAHFSSDDDQEADERAQVNELISEPIDECLGELARFFARRYGGGNGAASGGRRQSVMTRRLFEGDKASETLQFMRQAIKWTPPTTTTTRMAIAVQAADLVAFDTLNDSISVYLSTSGGVGQVVRRRRHLLRHRSRGANGSRASANGMQQLIRACHSRSQLSQLAVGCNRLFSATESSDGAIRTKCPQCGRQLVDLRAGGAFCAGGG